MKTSRWLGLLATSLFATQANAQSSSSVNVLGIIVSEGYSVYTEVTSLLSSVASAASSPTNTRTSTTSRTSSSSSSAVSSSSSSASSAAAAASSSLASASSSVSSSLSSGTVAAASTTPSTGPNNNGGHHHTNTLAIILGSVLGALALGLLLLVLLLCCLRRRRRSRQSLRSNTPTDHEVAAWRQKPSQPDVHVNTNVSTQPLIDPRSIHEPPMSEYESKRDFNNGTNPFVPLPPPPRKVAPNARAGLTDGMVDGADPYLMEKNSKRPITSRKSHDDTHKGAALAAGAGGAALGAAAMHHHNKHKESEMLDEKHSHEPLLGDQNRGHRGRRTDSKVSGQDVATAATVRNAAEPVEHRPLAHGFSDSTVPINDRPVHAAALRSNPYPAEANLPPQTAINGNRIGRKPVPESPVSPIVPVETQSYNRSSGIVPTPSSNDDTFALNRPAGRRSDEARRSLSRDAARANAVFDNEYSPHPHHSHGMPTAAAVGVGALGGAALANRHHRNSSNSRSPHRRALIGAREHASDTSSSSADYSDTFPRQQSNLPTTRQHTHMNVPPFGIEPTREQTLPVDIPPTPPPRSRRNSALGTAAPVTAALAYNSRNRSSSRSRPRSAEYQLHQTPPAIPNRSPQRNSFSDVPWGPDDIKSPPLREAGPDSDVFFNDPYIPPSNIGISRNTHNTNLRPASYPPNATPMMPADMTSSPVVTTSDRALVGDNGYPHLGIPRRKSGGQHDYDRNGPLGPQALRPNSPQDKNSSSDTSDGSSTWRLSSGMPGGWQREKPGVVHNPDVPLVSPLSPQATGRSNEIYPEGDKENRDSGISGMSEPSGMNGRRMRTPDARRSMDAGKVFDNREPTPIIMQEGNVAESYGGYNQVPGHHGVGTAL